MQGAARFLGHLAQPVEVGPLVFFGDEVALAAVPAPDDVERKIVEMDAGTAGHELILTN